MVNKYLRITVDMLQGADWKPDQISLGRKLGRNQLANPPEQEGDGHEDK